MKKLFCLCLSLCMFAIASFAQSTPTHEDYHRYIDSRLQLDFRNNSIEAAGLTSEEIVTFDPIFRDYMAGKEKLLKKKVNLLEAYAEEMKEDDSAKNQENDRADFVENYWEVEIDEMELSKRCFDILEDKIPPKKATKFFLYEDAVQNRVKQNVLTTFLPSVKNLDQVADKALAASASDIQQKNVQMYIEGKTPSEADYKRYIETKLEMDFRNESIKLLNLDQKQILAFDPIFKRYMAAREAILEKKVALLKDIDEELMEDDSDKNQAEDVADFIEDYWEEVIAESELRKDYFDILEDKIGVDNSIKFFLYEDAVQTAIEQNAIAITLPTIIILREVPVKTTTPDKLTSDEKMKIKDTGIDVSKEKTTNVKLSATTLKSVRDFDQWVMSNKGKVDLSHEYTSNGLTALANVLTAIKTDMNYQVADFDQNKKTILAAANHITIDPKQTTHADHTREAFLAASALMDQMNPANKGTLATIARDLNPDKLMTPQASTIYRFFEEVNRQLKQMTDMKYSAK